VARTTFKTTTFGCLQGYLFNIDRSSPPLSLRHPPKVKKHIRCFHSEKNFQCSNCDKAFCRPDKLRLHMLRHLDGKDFLCSTC